MSAERRYLSLHKNKEFLLRKLFIFLCFGHLFVVK